MGQNADHFRVSQPDLSLYSKIYPFPCPAEYRNAEVYRQTFDVLASYKRTAMKTLNAEMM